MNLFTLSTADGVLVRVVDVVAKNLRLKLFQSDRASFRSICRPRGSALPA